MNQQINLFQPIFRAQRKIFSAVVIAQIIAIFVSVLVLIYGYFYWQTHQQFNEYAQLQKQQALLADKLTKLQTTLPKKVKDPALVQKLETLKQERDLKVLAVNSLRDHSLGSKTGFSRELAGLGSEPVRGLWLTDILFAGGGTDFELGGEAMDARLVPQYLQNLAKDSVFSGMAFRSMQIGQPDAGSGASVSFLLSTASDIKDAQILQEARDAKAHR